MESLIPSFKESLFDPALKDIGADISELGIEGILSDETARQIPVVRVIYALIKTGLNIRDRKALLNTYKFIAALNNGTIDPEKVEKHRRKLDSNPSFAEKELGRVLVILDSMLDQEKSALLAKIYRAYVEERISWDEFCELSEVVDRMFLSDFRLLKDVRSRIVTNTTQCESHRADRLASLGLVSLSVKRIAASKQNTHKTDYFIEATSLGISFCELTA